ncbi:MAG: hypothetical protein ABIP19_00750 [Dermatophilaceae bacterium]
MTRRTTPGRQVSYGLALLVAVVGVATAMVWGVTGVLDQVQQPVAFTRADISGTVTVNLTQVGPHVIYYEGDDPAAIPADQLKVVDAAQRAVVVRPYPLDLRYDVPGRPGTLGTAIAVFDADHTGSFVIATKATAGDAQAQLAVGDDLAPAMVRVIVIPALAALLSITAAVALAARTWSRRQRKDLP